MGLSESITALHYDRAARTWVMVGLFPLYLMSLIFGAGMRLRAFLYRAGIFRSEKIRAVVVCVGNITTGGSGKTPAVIHIAQRLVDVGIKTAIISRGYGFPVSGEFLVVSGPDGVYLAPGRGPDEALMTAEKLPGVPVVVSPRRARAGLAACRLFGAEVVIMDDGFQHLALRRDINILVMDAACPFGNGMVLPAGPLREPPSAIGRADVIWLVGTGEIPPEVHTYAPDAPVVRAAVNPCGLKTGSGKEVGLETLTKKRVLAFAGIGRPGRFFETLDRLGAIVAERVTFPDHHRYSGEDLARLEGRAAAVQSQLVITTEKDLVRLPGNTSFARSIAALVMGLTVRGDDTLVNSIRAKLHKEST